MRAAKSEPFLLEDNTTLIVRTNIDAYVERWRFGDRPKNRSYYLRIEEIEAGRNVLRNGIEKFKCAV